MFVPGALDSLRLPVQGSDCASSVAGSLGYRDPRGYPVWQRSRVRHFDAVTHVGSFTRVTVTIRTIYAGGRTPSTEDDVIYLERSGSRWLLAKPSVTLYRAIGVPNAPPSVLAPP